VSDDPEATTNTAEVPTEADTTATQTTDTVDDTATAAADSATTKANREAAKYRLQVREREAAMLEIGAERDALAGRLMVLQRAEAERIAGAHLTDGADIWRDGADLAALVDDAGNIDPVKVGALASDIAEQHPHWVKKALPPRQIRRGGLSSGASTTADQSTPSWAAVLNVGHRR
jgi:hypothetical protein